MNEIRTADLMNGPVVGGRDCHLPVIIDDRYRYLTAARFVRQPNAVRFAGVFRAAIAHCGLPSTLYCDNGSCHADKLAAADLRRPRREADPQPSREAPP